MTPINIRKCASIVFLLAFPVLLGLLAALFNFKFMGIIADSEAIGLRMALQGYIIYVLVYAYFRYLGWAAERKSRKAKTDRNGDLAEL
jgi:hypothetical protein